MTLPTIHLNGTSKLTIMTEIGAAMDAVECAITALKKAAPHGRDYYPQGPGTYVKATEEHLARMDKLVAVSYELGQILCKIDEM